MRSTRVARAVVVPLALAGLLGGCGETERSRRYQLESERWRAMRTEQRWRETRRSGPELDADVVALHRDISRRWGMTEPPGITVLRDPDAVERLRLAASSALLAADLEARAGPTRELAEEYDRLGRVYGFDPDIRARAGLGAGKIWEGLGDRLHALGVYRRYLGRDGRPAPAPGPLDRVDAFEVDLEIHAAMLARDELPPDEAREVILAIQDRLARTVETWQDRPGVDRVRRRLAEASAILGDVPTAIETLEDVCGRALPGDERSELLLELGDLHYDREDRPAEAEVRFRESALGGDEIPAAAEARLRLGELLVRRGRAREGLEVLDQALRLGARVREGRQSEILYWKGRALVALGQWEDALPVLRDGATAEAGSPLALAAAGRYRDRLAGLRQAAVPGDLLLVETAERVPDPDGRVTVPRSWAEEERRARREAHAREGISALSRVAQTAADPEVRARAARALTRLDDRGRAVKSSAGSVE